MSDVDIVVLTMGILLAVGVLTYLFSEKTGISFVPILIVLGILAGPVLHLINRPIAHQLFDYAREFGLMIILFAEGHNLRWDMLKKHLATIGILDTVGLLITSVIAAFAFSFLFHVPFVVGFLFGAIIGATDPATLIPLFKQHKVDENIRSVLVTESIFNDPLGIVLTVLATALIVPQASSAHVIEAIAKVTTLYPAAVIFFVYEVGVSIAIGAILGLAGYWLIHALRLERFSEIYALALAFGGFAIGETAGASGYLVSTVIAIVLGNHQVFFGTHDRVENATRVISSESHFNELVAEIATVVIFILLGVTIDLPNLLSAAVPGTIVALVVVFIARPIASLSILPLGTWNIRQYGFMALEGPRGVVPSALAGVPLVLGQQYHNQQLVDWGEQILAATVIAIVVSVVLQTLWARVLNRKLLAPAAAES